MGKTACFFSWKCFRWREGLLRKSGVSWRFWVYPCLLFGKKASFFHRSLKLTLLFLQAQPDSMFCQKGRSNYVNLSPPLFFFLIFFFFGKGAASTQNATYWFAFLRQLWHAMAGLWYQKRENLDMIPSFLKSHISSQMETKVLPSSWGGAGDQKVCFCPCFPVRFFFLTFWGGEFHGLSFKEGKGIF